MAREREPSRAGTNDQNLRIQSASALMRVKQDRHRDWEVLPQAFRGSIFLLSLVLMASMMPVEKLPLASWPTALGLGFVSAVFDNIPLTALALKQAVYDWGFSCL